jgi:hypothetical protein
MREELSLLGVAEINSDAAKYSNNVLNPKCVDSMNQGQKWSLRRDFGLGS